jgi:hypothetical protein
MKKVFFLTLIILQGLMLHAQTPATTTPKTATEQVSKGKKDKPSKAKQPAEQRASQYANELKKSLSLTDDQYKKILAINTKCIIMKDSLKSGSKDKGAFQAGRKKIKEYRKAAFANVLSADQQSKLKASQGSKDKKGKDDSKDEDDDK